MNKVKSIRFHDEKLEIDYDRAICPFCHSFCCIYVTKEWYLEDSFCDHLQGVEMQEDDFYFIFEQIENK